MTDRKWEDVPVDDLEFAGMFDKEGERPIQRVLCECGSVPIIDDLGPGACSGCGKMYRINPITDGIEREVRTSTESGVEP